MKTLIVLSAPPACGKSTWARKYQSEHENCFIISSDGIRFEVTGTTTDFSRQKEVWEIFENRIHEYANKSEDVTVILDALNDLNWERIKYVKENPEYNRYVLVVFSKDLSKMKINNKKRDESAWVPDSALKELFEKFEEPNDEAKALFNEIIYVNEAI